MSEQCPGLSPERDPLSTAGHRGVSTEAVPSERALLAGPAEAPGAAALQPARRQEPAQGRRGAQVPAALQVDSFVGPLCTRPGTPGNLQPMGTGCSHRDGSPACDTPAHNTPAHGTLVHGTLPDSWHPCPWHPPALTPLCSTLHAPVQPGGTRGRRTEVTGMAEACIMRPHRHLGQACSRQGLSGCARSPVSRKAELPGCPSSCLQVQ